MLIIIQNSKTLSIIEYLGFRGLLNSMVHVKTCKRPSYFKHTSVDHTRWTRTWLKVAWRHWCSQVERATRRVSEDEGEEEDDEDSCSSRSSPEITSPEEEEAPEAPEAAPRARPRPKPRKNQQGATTEMKKFLEGLKYSHRVPFPELGADIVEGKRCCLYKLFILHKAG